MNRSTKGLLWAGAAVAVPMAVNAVIAAQAKRMEQPLPGEIGYYEWVYGRVAYYRMGQGAPLVLVHNPNAGGSSWEWRRAFPALAARYTVFALDLLGFGLSEKPRVPYSGPMMADLVHDFLEDVVREPAHAAGSALGSAYLVNAAVRRPEGLSRLVLVNPTGVTSSLPRAAETAVWGTFSTPVLGTSLYHGLVSRAGIRQELCAHTYYDPAEVTPELVDALYTAAHQPGSRHAAAAFIAGRLDLPLRPAFSFLQQPVLLIWGREAYYTPMGDAADLLYRHPQARLEILDECGMLPHDEKAGVFLRLVEEFLARPADGEMAA